MTTIEKYNVTGTGTPSHNRVTGNRIRNKDVIEIKEYEI